MHSILLINLLFAFATASVLKLDKFYTYGKVCDKFSNWKIFVNPYLYEGYRIQPNSALSCVLTEEFYITDGSLEATLYVDSKGVEDRVSLLLYQVTMGGIDELVSRTDLIPTLNSEGVEILTIDVTGTGQIGYAVLLGEASNTSTIIIEALKYNSEDISIESGLRNANHDVSNESKEDSMILYTRSDDDNTLSTVTLAPPTIPSPTTTTEAPTTLNYTDTDSTIDWSTSDSTYTTDSELEISTIDGISTDETVATDPGEIVSTATPDISSVNPETSSINPEVTSANPESSITPETTTTTPATVATDPPVVIITTEPATELPDEITEPVEVETTTFSIETTTTDAAIPLFSKTTMLTIVGLFSLNMLMT